jgi:LmbE family N-acetylglucosaminyl deacetylase
MTKINPTLLAVLAHPDDETFGMGGTLALYARRCAERSGQNCPEDRIFKVYLVCATRGEVGEMDPKLMEGFSSIAEYREHELRCAAGKLGLSGVTFLGYRDSGMPGSPDNQHPQALAAQPLEKVAGDVVAIMRQLQPQVVLTFDPIGGYRHPDHIAIQRATEMAFYAASDPAAYPEAGAAYQPAKLYFSTMPRGFLRVMVRVMRLLGKDPTRFGKNKDIDMASIAEVHFPTHARINYRPVAAIRDEASACHASQGGSQMAGGLIGTVRRWFFTQETYMRAYPPPVAGHIETDLFEGIEL